MTGPYRGVDGALPGPSPKKGLTKDLAIKEQFSTASNEVPIAKQA
jgi:hypothetical protein